MSKTIAAISIESLELIKRLSTAKVGELIPYKELSDIAMSDVQTEKRGALVTATKHLLNEKQMVFEAVRNVGLKRANDSEIVAHSEGPIEKIRRISKRAMKRLTCVDFDKLPNDQKIAHNSKMSVLGVLHQVTAPGKLKQIEAQVAKTNTRLNLETTLEAFKKS